MTAVSIGVVLVAVQARMSSSRLRGKILRPLGGYPALEVLTRRLQGCRMVDKVVLATSLETSDDAVESWCRTRGLECVRGPLDDVIGRLKVAVDRFRPEVLVRITGDCPFIDPQLVDEAVACLRNEGLDYCSNVNPPSFPDGLDVEAISAETFLELDRRALEREDREHVTLYLRKRLEQFRTRNFECPIAMDYCRLTLDTEEDYQILDRIATQMGDRLFTAGWKEFYELLPEQIGS